MGCTSSTPETGKAKKNRPSALERLRQEEKERGIVSSTAPAAQGALVYDDDISQSFPEMPSLPRLAREMFGEFTYIQCGGGEL
jgi:hypothetical protein